MDAEEAKAIVARYFQRLLNEQDLRVCEELLAADYVDHDAPSDTPPGPAATEAYMRGFFARHAELSFTIEHIIAEGDSVALRGVWRGVDRQSGGYEQTGIVLLHLNRQGQLRERWSGYLPRRDL
jgi:ketosteroid isomerase-like protein